jgi:putative aldouronate transport system substrate-binding protein
MRWVAGREKKQLQEKIMKTKAIIFIFALTIPLSIFASGEPEETVQDSALKLSAPGVFPIVEEQVSFSIFIQEHYRVEDWATNDMTMYMEELTNVHIEWETAPADSFDDKRRLLLASGDYTDVIMQGQMNDLSETVKYGAEGIFLPLNDLIDKHGVETKKLFGIYPSLKKDITTPDGSIYGLPVVVDDYHANFPQKFWINGKWVRDLGFSMPTTTDEFYEILKAFKTQDPNGNGIADEIPMSGAYSGFYTQVPNFLMNSFIYFNTSRDSYALRLEDGEIDYVAVAPEFRDGLRFYNKLYEEDLLDPGAFTQSRNDVRQLSGNPDGNLLGSSPAGSIGNIIVWKKQYDRYLNYEALEPLFGPNGFRTTVKNPLYWGGNHEALIITDVCEIPDVVMKWADHLYTREASLRAYLGRPDIEWRYGEPGEIGSNGKQALRVTLAEDLNVGNHHWAQVGPAHRDADIMYGNATDQSIVHQMVVLYGAAKNQYDIGVDPKEVYKPAYMTAEQVAEIGQAQTSIYEYTQESIVRFITGDLDLDKDWDSYVSELDKMGLERYLELVEISYNAQYK